MAISLVGLVKVRYVVRRLFVEDVTLQSVTDCFCSTLPIEETYKLAVS